ncbi:response regulator transcription factor [Spirosoma endophyticum]|uniref:Regulatory protein, luxR family n=1 Tax=Spirosoma endophyticum TaxID=662367 RepID=A0A1I1IPE2_9BACT|nr:helix-turn-helix transcriptional regulator [Spirosoma endophyticum]SFC38085.1 regulatory protein, luxR family [Spirosoma endophyticum]
MNQFTATLPQNTIPLNQRERQFLQLACSELTYAQIADRMCVSPRTVDGYRENLFIRLNLKSRVVLALWAVKVGIVTL